MPSTAQSSFLGFFVFLFFCLFLFLILSFFGGFLVLCMLSKNFNRPHFEIFFLFVPENRI